MGVLDGVATEINRLRRRVTRLEVQERGKDVEGAFTTLVNLPGLVGLWTMGGAGSAGNAIDSSGAGLELTYNGNPTYSNASRAPYIDLDGTGDYLVGASGGAFDITSDEAFFTNPGVTFGVWFFTTDATPGAIGVLGAKREEPDQTSWEFRLQTDGTVRAVVSDDGTTAVNVTSTNAASDSTWMFAAMRFTPSTSLDVCVNDTTTSNTTSIPATTFSSTASFVLGAKSGAANLFAGRESMAFLCATALDDDTISAIYENTRDLFGV